MKIKFWKRKDTKPEQVQGTEPEPEQVQGTEPEPVQGVRHKAQRKRLFVDDDKSLSRAERMRKFENWRLSGEDAEGAE
jgi:hypothetical protein